MEKFVILVKLMVALGYAEKNARGQATAQLKKLDKINPKFSDADYRKATSVLTMDEAMELLKGIASSKSKYKENAEILLNKGLDDDLLTDDLDYKEIKPKKTTPKKPKKIDLEKFIEIEGMQEKFNEWFKAQQNQG